MAAAIVAGVQREGAVDPDAERRLDREPSASDLCSVPARGWRRLAEKLRVGSPLFSVIPTVLEPRRLLRPGGLMPSADELAAGLDEIGAQLVEGAGDGPGVILDGRGVGGHLLAVAGDGCREGCRSGRDVGVSHGIGAGAGGRGAGGRLVTGQVMAGTLASATEMPLTVAVPVLVTR